MSPQEFPAIHLRILTHPQLMQLMQPISARIAVMRAWAGMAVVASALIACTKVPESVPAKVTPDTPPQVSMKAIPVVSTRPAADRPRHYRNEKGDLDAIIERGYLRVLVARSRTHFENHNGRVRGRAVDVGAELETMLNQRTASSKVSVVFIETAEDALIRDLLAGKGDTAANLLLTFERDDQVAFAKPLVTAIRELVVNGSNESRIVSLEDVGGRSIHVRASSDHYASLVRLNEQLKQIDRPQARIVVAPGAQTDEDLLDQVNAGTIPATLAFDYVYDACCRRLPGLKANRDVAVSQDGSLSWVTRKDAPQLLAFLNEFFSTHTLSFQDHARSRR